jgi:hypothetical protein
MTKPKAPGMWSTQREHLADKRILRVTVERESAPLPFGEVLRLWHQNEGFRSWYLSLLADAPYSAFRWETPAVTAATAKRPFEFVLLDSPDLEREPDAVAFADQFRGVPANTDVVSFSNFGKDAILVVPCPVVEPSAYGHLAAFIRHAPEQQQHALWALVGKVMEQRLGRAPVWLSTAGAGVSWLHVRVDSRPKYYGYRQYRDFTP